MNIKLSPYTVKIKLSPYTVEKINELTEKHKNRKDFLNDKLNSLIMQSEKTLTPTNEGTNTTDSSIIETEIENVLKSYFKNNENDKTFKFLIKYGLEYGGKLRKVEKLIRKGILPDHDDLKHSICTEARYGSYINAELLMAYFLQNLSKYDKTSNILLEENNEKGGDQSGFVSIKKESVKTNLYRSFNSIIRFSPTVSLALYYFNLAMEVLGDLYFKVYPALIYNLCLALPEYHVTDDDNLKEEMKMLGKLIENFNTDASEAFKDKKESEPEVYTVFKDVLLHSKQKIDLFKKNFESFENDNKLFKVEISSVSTSGIDTYKDKTAKYELKWNGIYYSRLAETSINIQNIEKEDIEMCLKQGNALKELVSYTLKVKNDNLIIFCRVVVRNSKKYIFISNVYRVFQLEMKEEKDEIVKLCDELLQLLLDGEYEEFEKKSLMLKERDFKSDEEKDFVRNFSKVLITDSLPTFDLVLKISKLMFC